MTEPGEKALSNRRPTLPRTRPNCRRTGRVSLIFFKIKPFDPFVTLDLQYLFHLLQLAKKARARRKRSNQQQRPGHDPGEVRGSGRADLAQPPAD